MEHGQTGVERMAVIHTAFWQGRRVFVTGHTGFKGSWLCLWLEAMGAHVTGYALAPSSIPSMFELCGLGSLVTSHYGDIRDSASLRASIQAARPDIVIHMAAQPLVRQSYALPAETYEINVMGTVRLFEAVRDLVLAGYPIKAVVHVSADTCYDNKEWAWGYRETEPLGGNDPHSSSKACSELIVAAYRSSFFHPARFAEHGVAVASARAGDVVGGGDWALDRVIPEVIASLQNGDTLRLRHLDDLWPWQHVLEPLSGYLLLAEKLVRHGPRYASAWNFGPSENDMCSMESVVRRLAAGLRIAQTYETSAAAQPGAHYPVRLDCAKARIELGWRPTWDVATALDKLVDWMDAYQSGADMRVFTLRQVRQYLRDSR